MVVNQNNWKVRDKVRLRKGSIYYNQASKEIGEIMKFDSYFQKQAWVTVKFKDYQNQYQIGPTIFDLEFVSKEKIYELWI